MPNDEKLLFNFARDWFERASADSSHDARILEMIKRHLNIGHSIDEDKLFRELIELAKSLEQTDGN